MLTQTYTGMTCPVVLLMRHACISANVTVGFRTCWLSTVHGKPVGDGSGFQTDAHIALWSTPFEYQQGEQTQVAVELSY